ncbi:MAG: hypothetical protein ACI8RZ_003163 [Myxococcota bacterium]|jgi:hypothetical protein
MLSWLLPLLLSSAQATQPDDAAAILSRYPAGMVPGSESVMDAIEALATSGSPAHRAVLESLQEMEEPPIARAAGEALTAIDRRSLRSAYTAPDSRQIRRWLSEQPRPMQRADGSPMGHTEQEALGYAVLILGAPRGEDVGPTHLLKAATHLEDTSDTAGALTLYARAASLGDASALTTIENFGVNPELLLLGMSVSSAESLVDAAPPEALDVLIREGSTSTVAVLIERADTASHIDRAVALDALAEMLRTTPLTASARRSARSELEKAAMSGREEALSAFAREALADMEW